MAGAVRPGPLGGYEAKAPSEEKAAPAAANASSQSQAKPNLKDLISEASKNALAALDALCTKELKWYHNADAREKKLPGVVIITRGNNENDKLGFRPSELLKSAPDSLMSDLAKLSRNNPKVFKVWELIHAVSADTIAKEARTFGILHIQLAHCHNKYAETKKPLPLSSFFESPVYCKAVLDQAVDVAKKLGIAQ